MGSFATKGMQAKMTNTVEELEFYDDAVSAIDLAEVERLLSQSKSRPLRRYGIEVDRVEDVGVMVMCEGIYPRQVMTWEERNSLPQEVQDKAEAALRYFFENSKTMIKESIKSVLRDQLESGFPISYGDKEGRVLRRYPNRQICVATIDKKTFEKSETFLRMATPKDDIGIYD